MNTETIEIYVKLLGDEEGTLRPTQAVFLGENKYRILPTPNYSQSEEDWEYKPGSIVKGELRKYREKSYLLAVNT